MLPQWKVHQCLVRPARTSVAPRSIRKPISWLPTKLALFQLQLPPQLASEFDAGYFPVLTRPQPFFWYLQTRSKRPGSGAKTLGSQIMNLTSVSILTHFLLTDKLLGYFPVNLDQFAASGNKRDVNRSSGSCARALERHDPFLGGGADTYVRARSRSLRDLDLARTRCQWHQAVAMVTKAVALSTKAVA